MDDKDKEIMSYLEERGAVIWEGMDDNGEAIFKFDLEKLKTVMPPLYNEIMAELDEDLMALYKEGLIDIEYDENLNALFRMSEKGRKIFEDNNPSDFFNS